MFVSSVSTATARALRCGASTLALACAVMQPATAWAQDVNSPDTAKPLSTTTDPDAVANPEAATPKGAIIVTGTRRALRTSQQIKRNADTVVDSITATDIGAFPDKSVAEALQRVPGITVNRFAASSDTAHFSAEPSGVLVRGLPQVRSEFNGRDTFSADSSRGLSWGDISPELMAGVDTYKNQTADLIEGGIAGSINLRTRVPFDAEGQLIQASVNLLYGDLARKVTPEFSVFYSNRWQTGMGEIGIMLNGAFSKVITRSEGIQYMRGAAYDNAFGPDGPAIAYVPSGIAFRDNAYYRTRKGGAAAFQWRSNDHKWLMTAQYNRSDYSNVWRERGVQNEFASLYGAGVRTRFGTGPGESAPGFLAPPGGSYTFGSDGVFQSGTFTRPNVGWFGPPTGQTGWGNDGSGNPCTFQTCGGQGPSTAGNVARNDQGQPMFYNCYGWAGAGATVGEGGPLCSSVLTKGTNGDYQGATDLYTISRYAETFTKTQDASINLKWQASDRLRFNFDGQYVNAATRNYDIEIDLASFTTPTLDASGSLPRIVFGPPVNVNQSAGGLSNPNNYYVRSVMDHMENAKGTEWAGRADGEYDIGTTWMNQLKFGARYSDRDQQVNWAAYNWQNVANTWTGGCQYTYFNLDSQPATCTANGQTTTFNGYPANFYTMAQFGQPFHGGNLGTFPFVPFDFLQNHGADGFSFEKTGVGNFLPECDRNGQSVPGSNNTNGGYPVNDPNSPGGCYSPLEITRVSESTRAGYVMLKFGGPDAHLGSLGVSGNIGLRYINTVDHSPGFLAFPTSNYNTNACPATPLVPGGFTGTGTAFVPVPGQPPQVPFPAYCYLAADDIAFAGGGGSYTDAKATHNNLLPSFNVRFDISPKWLIRFALSKALSRPDIGQLKNIGSIGQGLPTATAINDPRYIKNSSGTIIGVTPEYTGSSFNPFLKPITAWQADVSLENYFANVGSFTIAAFYKKFYDYIQFGPYNREITANGVTRNVQLRGPLNGSGAEIRGVEVAYQRFFDFLPQPLDGLGIQANFTLVDNHGIKNTNLTSVGSGAGDTTTAGTSGQSLNPNALEGLSKYSFNLVGMYEKGPLAVRLAYNWRSSYLVTAYDCCVYLPVWQQAAGFLDGTIRYAITPQVELNVKGTNLLNTQTRLLQQITDDMDPEGHIVRIPNAYFINDRRFEIGARMKFGGTAPLPPAPPPMVAPPPPAPAMQTCADGSAILATDVCPVPPPPPPPPAPAPVERGERGL